MRLAFWLTIWATVPFAVGCSSHSTGASRGAAADKCDAVGDKICGKLAPCTGTSHDDCVRQFNQGLKSNYGSDCSGADLVSETYQSCLHDLDTLACGQNLPASCQGVILFAQ